MSVPRRINLPPEQLAQVQGEYDRTLAELTPIANNWSTQAANVKSAVWGPAVTTLIPIIQELEADLQRAQNAFNELGAAIGGVQRTAVQTSNNATDEVNRLRSSLNH
jgi:hypothetical protein